MPIRQFAEALAALPSCAAADAAALAAAKANGYARAGPDRSRARQAGRALDADALVRSGIAELCRTGEGADLDAVARDFAGYLAGPPVQIWDYAILDASIRLSEPVPVVDGWELCVPTADERRALLPLPSTARQQSHRPFDPDMYGGLAMLRRPDPDDRPYRGLAFSWPAAQPAHRLWQPLVALCLFDNAVLRLWARYRVEPGRRVDQRFDQVEWTIWTPDGEIEVEVPDTGQFTVGREGEARLRRFLVALAPRLEAAAARQGKPAERLRRCAEHLLTAGEHAYGEGEVPLSEHNAETARHYVIALNPPAVDRDR